MQQQLLFDVETDSLLPSLTKVWCMSMRPLKLTQPLMSSSYSAMPPLQHYGPDQLEQGLHQLKKASTLIGHNVLGFDLPAVWKCSGGWDSVPLVLDTLVLSRFLHPERYGGHSLEAWGERLGFPKGDFNDYSQYSAEMREYCNRDVELNYLVLEQLLKEYSEKYNGATITEGFNVYS